MRARAQQLERASESPDSNHAAPQTVITVGTPPSAERPANQGRPVRGALAEVDGALDRSRPEMLAAPPETHVDLVNAGWRPSMETERAGKSGCATAAATRIWTSESPAPV